MEYVDGLTLRSGMNDELESFTSTFTLGSPCPRSILA